MFTYFYLKSYNDNDKYLNILTWEKVRSEQYPDKPTIKQERLVTDIEQEESYDDDE